MGDVKKKDGEDEGGEAEKRGGGGLKRRGTVEIEKPGD